MKAGDIVSHADYGVGRVRDVRRAGREANVDFHLGIVMLCPTVELKLLGTGGGPADGLPEIVQPTPAQTPVNHPVASPPGPFNPLPVQTIRELEQPASSPSIRTAEAERNGDEPARPAVMQPVTAPPVSFAAVAQDQARAVQLTTDEQFQSRQVIEALRLGVVPRFRINDLTIGLKQERATVEAAFERTERYGGDVCAVVGEYGTGKSHFFEWTATEALNRGYLVANASLDVWETPPSKPFRIYNALVSSLRYPDRNDTGTLGGLFERIQSGKGTDALRRELTVFHDFWDKCPLFDALRSYVRYRREGDEERAGLILRWIAGERLPVWALYQAKIKPVDTLRTYTTAADQYCYLLNGIAWLARQVGYKGLVALVDESEHYSLLTKLMKERADVFFQGMIYSALGDRQTRVPLCRQRYHGRYCGLPHGGNKPYPFSYSPESGLLFMFAATTSTIALDYTSWLDPDKILRLESRLSSGEIEELLARIYVFHRKAFKYDRKANFAETSAELISLYESGRFNLRELIRVSTEAFDLIYTYPGYIPQLED